MTERVIPERVCAQCSAPFTSRDKRQRFCSRACVWASARVTLTTMRSEGRDPTHGGNAADARRASLARRRAAGEPIGRAAAKAKREGTYSKPDVPAAPVDRHTRGIAWRESGAVWDAYAAKIGARDSRRGGKTIIITGHGAGMRVDHNALIVMDGRTHSTQEPTRHTLHRATHGVERIVCLAPSGSITFDALEWCRQQGIGVTIIDRDGDICGALTPEYDGDIALRRRQYAAYYTGHHHAVARWMIERKIQGQRDTLHGCPLLPGAAAAIDGLDAALAELSEADHEPGLSTAVGIMMFEGRAAALYFDAWKGYPLSWRKSDRRYVPPHWLTIRQRHSPLSDSARRAIDPCNAILNYAYGVLAGQCKQALIVDGFDASAGVLHADRPYRDALVYDLMEIYRPAVDATVLAFLGRTTLTLGDCLQLPDGRCRLHPQLARAVVAACRLDSATIAAGVAALRTRIEGVLTA